MTAADKALTALSTASTGLAFRALYCEEPTTLHRYCPGYEASWGKKVCHCTCHDTPKPEPAPREPVGEYEENRKRYLRRT
jgi:hypothetical protein